MKGESRVEYTRRIEEKRGQEEREGKKTSEEKSVKRKMRREIQWRDERREQSRVQKERID